MQDPVADVCKMFLPYTHLKLFFYSGKTTPTLTFPIKTYGTIEMGIAATNMNLKEDESGLNMKVDYALDMNQEHVADCCLAIQAQPKNCKNFTL